MNIKHCRGLMIYLGDADCVLCEFCVLYYL